MAYQNQQNQQNQGRYKINKRPKDDTIEFLIVGDELNTIREEISTKFVRLAGNMEYQIAELKRQIAAEKQLQTELKQDINLSDQQRDEFKTESNKKTQDMKQINSFYTKNKGNQQQFTDLLNNIIARHQSFQQSLQQINYNGNVAAINKAWQDEIYAITQFIINSPDASEFAAICDEMRQRTNELNTIKEIEEGKISYEIMQDLVDKCEERHAFQCGDAMSGYKGPGQISNDVVLENNSKWEGLLTLLKDFIIQNQERLLQRNELYLAELSGRINDLNAFKKILNVTIEEKKDNYGRKMKAKDLRAMKSVEVRKQTKNLTLNVQQRHKENEQNVQNTINMSNNKDNAELQSLKQNDNGWRNEFNQDTELMIEYLV